MDLKIWLAKQIAGPFGIVVKPVMSAVFGTLVLIAYTQMQAGIDQVLWLKAFINMVMSAVPAETLSLLTPQAIGTTAAIAFWGLASEWIISQMKGGAKEIQTRYNDSPSTGNIPVDGLILPDGKTVKAMDNVISRVEYEKIYPQDTDTRPGQGVPEVRRPIP